MSLSDYSKEESIWGRNWLVSELTVHFADDLELAVAIPGQLLTCIRKLKVSGGLRKFYFSQGIWLVHWRVLGDCQLHEISVTHD